MKKISIPIRVCLLLGIIIFFSFLRCNFLNNEIQQIINFAFGSFIKKRKNGLGNGLERFVIGLANDFRIYQLRTRKFGLANPIFMDSFIWTRDSNFLGLRSPLNVLKVYHRGIDINGGF